MRLVPTTLAAVAAAGVLVIANPAFAAGPYTVTSGTKSKGTDPYTATSGAIQFKTSGGQNLTCSSSSAGGTIKLGSGQSGKGIAKIATTTFNGCTGPAGIPLNVKQTSTWLLNATGVPTGGVTDGGITKIKAHVSDNNGQCAFDVAGAVDGNFDANAQKLNVTTPRTKKTKLTLSGVSGCFGLINNGDTATFTTVYTLVAKSGKVNITSP